MYRGIFVIFYTQGYNKIPFYVILFCNSESLSHRSRGCRHTAESHKSVFVLIVFLL